MSLVPALSMRQSKTELFDQFARIGKALSSGIRIEILDLLAQSERNVDALAEILNQSVQNISQHLQMLRHVKLIESRKVGNFVLYRLADNDVIELVSRLQSVAQQRLSEIEAIIKRFTSHAAEFEAVDSEELLRRVAAGDVIVIDVRPQTEFAAAHLPGAVNVPLNEVEQRLGELSKNGEIVAYCRGRFCLLAYAAVNILRANGIDAKRLSIGVSEWKLKRLPLISESKASAAPARARRTSVDST